MKYIFRFFLLIISFASFSDSFGQSNIPNTSASSASNTITNIITYPSSYSLPSNPTFNYVRTWIPTRPLGNEAQLTPTTSFTDINSYMSTEYMDGMGRTIQSIKRANGNSYDAIQNYDYRPNTYSVSLLPYAGGLNSKFKTNTFNEQKSYYSGKFPNEGTTAFSMSENSSSPTDRTIHSYQPGKAFVGQKNGGNIHSELNSANEVMIWVFDKANRHPDPALGYYAAGQLLKTITKLPASNSELTEYTDKEGKLICKKAKTFGTCGNSSCPVELITYYIYDNLGRLVMTIPPKALSIMLDPNNTASLDDIVAEFCPYTIYDDEGRLVEKHIPGQQGNQLYIYDRYDHVVLMQTPLLKQLGKWLFNMFDTKGRLIMTALHDDNSSTFQSSIQNLLDDPSTWFAHYNPQYFTFYLLFGQAQGSYNQHPVYYQSIPNTEILSYYYYDDYTNTVVSAPDNNTQTSYWFTGGNPAIIAPSITYNTYGKLTGKKVKVLQTDGASTPADWVDETYFYDRFGNVIHTVGHNALGGKDVVTNQFTFTSQPVRTILDHNNPQSSKANTNLVLDFKYSFNHKLVDVSQNLDFANSNGTPIWRNLAHYTYNDLGVLTSKQIGGSIESQIFDYNIRGQLTGINKTYAENVGNYSLITFGESLKYDFGFTNPKTDGSVSGIIWRGSGSSPSRAYAYDYDPSGRLLQAEYSEFTKPVISSPKSWNKTTGDYSLSNVTYDNNGNIRTLKHMATVNTGTASTVLMDDLVYHYDNYDVSNKLQYVTDNVPSSLNLTYNQNDFIDRHANYTDYSYDDDGNLTKDLNKNISYIHYNHLGLPYEVGTTTGNTIYYTYDAEGVKIREEIQDATGNTVYDYVRQFVYKDNDLQLLHHAEGRCRWLPNSSEFKYDYFVKDHLGNVRSVLTTDEYNGVQDYVATSELVAAIPEGLIFDNIDHTRDTKPDGYPGDMEAARLDGRESNLRIGPALAIRVMAGDKVHLKTYGYWEENGDINSHTTAEDMVGSILNSLSGSAQGLADGEVGGMDILNNLFNEQNYNDIYDALKENNTNPEKPRAYLNYIFYDLDMNIIPDQSGVLQLDGEPNNWFEMDLANDIQVEQNGYLVAYLSNEQFMSVYFDNMRVTHYRGRLLEEQHYYPHGLVINHSSIPSLVDRQRLYQTKEWNKELTLYDFHARQYDPQLGRFTSLDPKGQFSSGYIGMGNNPVTGIDPDGQWVNFVIGAVIGGVSGYMIGRSQGATGWGMVGYIGMGAIVGVMTAGIGSAASAATTAAMGTAASSTVLGGAVAGAAGGATAGLVGGMAMSSLSGGSFSDMLEAGGKGAVYGGIGGAILGGMSQGIRNVRAGNKFWSGYGGKHAYSTSGSADWEASQTRAKQYSSNTSQWKKDYSGVKNKIASQFGINQREGFYDNLTVRPEYGTTPHGLNESGYFVNSDGSIDMAVTYNYTNGILLKVSPGLLNVPDYQFQAIIGHELTHMYHLNNIPAHLFNEVLSEKAAWRYSTHIYIKNLDFLNYSSTIRNATYMGQWGEYPIYYHVPSNYSFSIR